MKARNKYISLFLLFLFLSPLVEIGIHDFTHRDDSHCLSDQKHFHKQEHNCSLCDYTFSSCNPSTENQSEILQVSLPVYYPAFLESGIQSVIEYKFSPRAPPVLS
jgi:hypothetical protein